MVNKGAPHYQWDTRDTPTSAAPWLSVRGVFHSGGLSHGAQLRHVTRHCHVLWESSEAEIQALPTAV